MQKFLSLKWLFLIYSLPVVLVVSLLSVFGAFERPDHFFLDRAFQWRGTQDPAPEIAIVAISQQDFERGAPRWPWPRSLIARLIDQVSQHSPAVIVIDILYTEKSNTDTIFTREQFAEIQPFLYQVLSGVPLEIQTRQGTRVIGPGSSGFDQIASGAGSAKAQDLELVRAVRAAVDSGVPVVLAAQSISGQGVAGLAEPFRDLAAESKDSLGLVGVSTDSDGVLRRYLPYGRDKDAAFVYGLALQAVAKYLEVPLPERPLPGGDVALGSNRLVQVSDGQFLVNFPGPPGTYPTYLALDVLRADQDLSGQLQDKIVFIGVTDPSVEDLLPTPYSGVERMAGVEFHAAAADTVLRGSFIGSTPRYQLILMVVILGLGAIAFGRFIRPIWGFVGVVAMLTAIFAAWLGSFTWVDYFLPITALLTVVFSGYLLALGDRVGVEQLEKRQARSMQSSTQSTRFW